MASDSPQSGINENVLSLSWTLTEFFVLLKYIMDYHQKGLAFSSSQDAIPDVYYYEDPKIFGSRSLQYRMNFMRDPLLRQGEHVTEHSGSNCYPYKQGNPVRRIPKIPR